MENNQGWIKLHRKIIDMPEWLAEPFTKGQAWIDLLLLANHKQGFIRKRGILIAVDRGQVGYSEDILATRWKWSRGKVKRFLSELTRLSQIDHKISEKTVQKNTSVSALISITNYDKYQMSDTEDGTEDGRKTVQEQRMKRMKRNKSPDSLSEIPVLMKRYSDQETINQAFRAIASTRKSNQIADSVKLSILQSWERYPVNQVMEGIKNYLNKGYGDQGKKEAYLLGIIRNVKPEESISGPVRKATGSPLLDDHYRSQGIRII